MVHVLVQPVQDIVLVQQAVAQSQALQVLLEIIVTNLEVQAVRAVSVTLLMTVTVPDSSQIACSILRRVVVTFIVLTANSMILAQPHFRPLIFVT